MLAPAAQESQFAYQDVYTCIVTLSSQGRIFRGRLHCEVSVTLATADEPNMKTIAKAEVPRLTKAQNLLLDDSLNHAVDRRIVATFEARNLGRHQVGMPRFELRPHTLWLVIGTAVYIPFASGGKG